MTGSLTKRIISLNFAHTIGVFYRETEKTHVSEKSAGNFETFYEFINKVLF